MITKKAIEMQALGVCMSLLAACDTYGASSASGRFEVQQGEQAALVEELEKLTIENGVFVCTERINDTCMIITIDMDPSLETGDPY